MKRRFFIAAVVLVAAVLGTVACVAYATSEYSRRPLDLATFDRIALRSTEKEVLDLIRLPPGTEPNLGGGIYNEIASKGGEAPVLAQHLLVTTSDGIEVWVCDGSTVKHVWWEYNGRML